MGYCLGIYKVYYSIGSFYSNFIYCIGNFRGGLFKTFLKQLLIKFRKEKQIDSLLLISKNRKI